MDINDLFLCPICRNIPPDKREAFIEDTKPKTKIFNKGELVAGQGDTVDALYILLKGSVKTEMISESGAILKIETIVAPKPLAPAFLFAEKNRFPVDVIALEVCEIVMIPRSSVIKQLSCNEAFLQGFMIFNSNRTNFLSERIKLFSIKTIKGKLSQYILERTRNQQFVLDMNQTQLAEYFGVARPSLARCLSEMIDDKIITLHKKHGEVLNLNALKEFVIQ